MRGDHIITARDVAVPHRHRYVLDFYSRRLSLVLYLVGMLILIIIDRVLKVGMTVYLADGVKPFIPGFIQFRYIENTGAAFGSFQGMTLVLTILTSVLILILLYVIVSKMFKSKLANISLMLITAGGLGNLYDRIFNGYVVDYLEFMFVDYAIFNFADTLITIGAILLVIYFLFFDRDFFQKKPKDAIEGDKGSDSSQTVSDEDIKIEEHDE